MTYRAGILIACVVAMPLAARDDPPSHKPVGTGLEGDESPESRVAGRLGKQREELNKLKELLADKSLSKDVMGLARKLMADRKLMESLKDRFSPEDLRSLRDQFRKGELPDHELVRKILQDRSAIGKMTPEQQELVKRWSEKIKEKGPDTPPGFPPDKMPPVVPPVAPPPVAPPQRGPTMPDWMRERLREWAGDAATWAKGDSGRRLRDMLEQLVRSREEGSAIADGLARRASGLGAYIPRLSQHLPSGLSGRLPEVGVPSLRQLPSPRSTAETGKSVLLFACVVAAVLFAWRAVGWYRAEQARRAAEWRLGPWPLEPASVRTREQLVRAFDYLAFLLLGRPARSLSHRDVAAGIGNPQATELADAYEKARYAPAADEMSDEEIARARKNLCDLARAA